MSAQVMGVVRGNTVVIDNDDLQNYDGEEVILTFMNYVDRKQKQSFDILQFVKPDERAVGADEYVRGLRDNDRL